MSESLVSKFPRDMFVISYHHFRRVMCSNKYTLEQKDSAFESLAQDYIRCDLEDDDVTSFVAAAEEWAMRGGYEVRP